MVMLTPHDVVYHDYLIRVYYLTKVAKLFCIRGHSNSEGRAGGGKRFFTINNSSSLFIHLHQIRVLNISYSVFIWYFSSSFAWKCSVLSILSIFIMSHCNIVCRVHITYSSSLVYGTPSDGNANSPWCGVSHCLLWVTSIWYLVYLNSSVWTKWL